MMDIEALKQSITDLADSLGERDRVEKLMPKLSEASLMGLKKNLENRINTRTAQKFGNQTSGIPANEENVDQKISRKMMGKIFAIGSSLGLKPDKVKEMAYAECDVTSMNDLTISKANAFITLLDNYKPEIEHEENVDYSMLEDAPIVDFDELEHFMSLSGEERDKYLSELATEAFSPDRDEAKEACAKIDDFTMEQVGLIQKGNEIIVER